MVNSFNKCHRGDLDLLSWKDNYSYDLNHSNSLFYTFETTDSFVGDNTLPRKRVIVCTFHSAVVTYWEQMHVVSYHAMSH